MTIPAITAQPTNKSATVGNTATFTGAASGTPTPDLQWQELAGSTAAAVITGTPQAIVVAITASPGAQSVTVPADAEGVIVFYAHWTTGGNSLTSLSSDFADTFTIDQVAAVASVGGTGIAYARVTSTGAKTITPTWSNGHATGPGFIVAFVKGITPSGTWIRDTFHGATDTDAPVNGSVESTVDDLVLAFNSGDGGSSPSTPSGWTSLQTQTTTLATYTASSRLSSADSPGAATTSVSSQSSMYYPTLSVVSLLPGSASAWTDVTTGTGFTTGSWTTAAQTEVGITTIRLKATNDSGTVYSNEVTLTVTAGGVDLTVANASHAQTAGNLTLTSATAIAVNSAAHAQAAGSLGLTAATGLALANAAHAQTADNVTLTVGGIGLSVDSATHAQAAGNLTLSSSSFLIVADASHGQTADLLTLSTDSFFAVDGATHAQTADSLTLDAALVLGINPALHGQSAEAQSLTTASWTEVADAVHQQFAGSIYLGGLVSLSAKSTIVPAMLATAAVPVNPTTTIVPAITNRSTAQ